MPDQTATSQVTRLAQFGIGVQDYRGFADKTAAPVVDCVEVWAAVNISGAVESWVDVSIDGDLEVWASVSTACGVEAWTSVDTTLCP